ncbi:MAG: type II toxin-antitoxin system VapC family toxin [Deltaproteobacteria bacterium]|nr:type II toxin-antitoxin system VapC family toxin [Deltaproteobacteria bacterium]
MKVVLDTHVFLWLVNGDELPKGMTSLRSGKDELLISSISAWELFMLVKRDFILLDRAANEWIDTALHDFGIKCADITAPIAFQAANLEWDHRDPADRFIVSTAIESEASVATRDKKIRSSGLVRIYSA